MRYICISILLIIWSLEVASQQLPEIIDRNTHALRFVNSHVCQDLKVFSGDVTEDDDLNNSLSILGTAREDSNHTTFTPLVPFDLDKPYTLVCDNESVVFTIDRTVTDKISEVIAIYPSTKEVPANILKWYIEFSQPVNPVKIYDHIYFADEYGQEVDRSILNLAAPLLSDDGTLLTVWVEPGRQKRMLGPNEHLGSVFEKDKSYTLNIASTLKDINGVPVRAAVSHQFKVVEADRSKPSISQWEVIVPEANSQETLRIVSEEQIDYGSLLDAFSVMQGGVNVRGDLAYDGNKGTIEFKPFHKWSQGEYVISVDYILEDLAGNNLLHLFDRPIDEDEVGDLEREIRFRVE